MKILFVVFSFICFGIFALDLPPITELDVNTRAICAAIYGMGTFIGCIMPSDRN